MPITPADIRDKEFRLALRGYAVDDVDTFLNTLQAEISTLRHLPSGQECNDIPGKIDSDHHSEDGDASSQALAVLRLAQQTADASLEEARLEAARLRRTALAESERLRETAAAEAEEILAKAQQRAQELLTRSQSEAGRLESEMKERGGRELVEMEQRSSRLSADIDRLQHLDRSWRERLGALLHEHQQLLDATPAAPTTPLDTGNSASVDVAEKSSA